MTTLGTTEIDTPLGPLTLALRGEVLCGAMFTDRWAYGAARLGRRFGAVRERSDPAPASVRERFEAYWAGALDALDALDVDLGGTPFQASVWAALRRIPAGHAVSYKELASMAGAPSGSRAAGAANAANPVSIVIPCHRVIRADGSPCGYAGGVPRKLALLAHEGYTFARGVLDRRPREAARALDPGPRRGPKGGPLSCEDERVAHRNPSGAEARSW